MNALLTRMGVPDAVQEFFDSRELSFFFGNDLEKFDAGFHLVPTTRNLWTAGKELAREVIITSGAMEAIAFAACNLQRYASLDMLSFVAIGNLPAAEQLAWISSTFPKRKFTLVFGNDLTGRLADIKIAAGLNGHAVRMTFAGRGVELRCGEKLVWLDAEKLNLNMFEKAVGIRTGIRTLKPKTFNTFLEQLKNNANQ